MSAGPAVLVNGTPGIAVSALDRGLMYGDGLFETLLCVGGHPTLWSGHVARLRAGCERLRIPAPDANVLEREIERVVAGRARCVVKVVVTRGPGGRGYAPPAEPSPTRIVARFDEVPVWATDPAGGITASWCATRLGINPTLAGLKHLNRIEQVLARSELRDPRVAEGLMCDVEGHAVCAIAANLFAVIGGRLTTPALERCGVAGVARAELIDARTGGDAVEVRDMFPGELDVAGEVFLCNSVRGVVPVTRLGEQTYAVGPLARAAQAVLARRGLPPGP